MKQKSFRLFSLSLAMVLLAACVHQPVVKHDEVLIYNKAFDYTYAGVLKAVDEASPWQLEATNREHGIIQAYNTKYWDSLDADQRRAVIQLSRISRKKTSVQLAPESQNVVGVGDILKAIDEVLGRYRA